MPIQLQLGSTPPPVDPAQEREKRRRTRFWTGAALIISLLAFVMVLRLYAFEGTVVTSGSMEPTLQKGDYALFDHRIALRNHWNRGDIVIFETPRSWEGGGEEGSEDGGSFQGQTLVKRIVGVPGETVSVLNGTVYINGHLLEHQDYLKEVPKTGMSSVTRLDVDQYFMMGDNRNNSDDSRNNGPISEGDIRGRVLFTLWPLSRVGRMPSLNYGDLATDN